MFVKPVPANVDGAIGRLEKLCHGIRTWMRSNSLKLNYGKTEMLLIGSRQQLSKIALPGVTVGEKLIAPATTVKDFCAVFDMHMTMVPHVNALAQSARYHIRNIAKNQKIPWPRLVRVDCPCLCYVAPGPRQRPARWYAR